MTNSGKPFTEISQRQAAFAAGGALLLMVFLAPIAYFSVIQNLIVPGDAQATVANILNSLDSFRMSILMLLFVAMLDIVVAWGLYVLLKPINKSLSLLMAWIRVVYAAIYVVAIANLYNVLPLLGDSGYTALLGTDSLNAQVMLLVDSFRNEWDIGLGIFGIHLFLLGYMVFKSNQKILGGLVILAGFGYFIDSFGKILMADYSLTVSLYTFAGEILLIFWLFWMGVKGVPKTLEKT